MKLSTIVFTALGLALVATACAIAVTDHASVTALIDVATFRDVAVAMGMAVPASRGIMSVRAETPDVKEVLAKLNSAFEEFKTKNDERIDALAKGKADSVLNDHVDRINSSITDLQAQLAEVATKAAAAGLNGNASDDLARDAAIFSKERGTTISAQDYGAYKDGLNIYMRRGGQTPSDVKAAMSVGSDPDGGYSVTPDTSGRIVKKIFETSPMRQVASVVTIGTDRLEGFNDLGEGTAGWVGETAARPATGTAQLGKWEIPVHEMYAFPQATQKLLDDSMFDIEAWLADKTSDKFTRSENAAFLNGDGVLKPRGLMTYPTAATADSSRSWGTFQHILTGTDGTFGTTTNGTDKLIDLVYSLKAGYRANANFMMSRATIGAVRKIKDGQGNYAWQPSLSALSGGTILGFNVVEAEDMPAMAADSLSVAFGDFREAYQIVDRVGIRVLRDPLTNKPYVGFYTTKRVGGDAIHFEAVKFLKFGD